MNNDMQRAEFLKLLTEINKNNQESFKINQETHKIMIENQKLMTDMAVNLATERHINKKAKWFEYTMFLATTGAVIAFTKLFL